MTGHFIVKVRKKTRVDHRGDQLTIGTRSSCGLVLEDPIAAVEHCRIDFDGEHYGIADLHTSTGTYVSGRAVDGRVALADGDEIVVGATRLGVTLEPDAGRLILQLEANSFHFEKTRAGAYRSDPDRWTRAETSMGRWAPYRWGILLSLLIALVGVPLTCTRAVGEPLFDPGPLARIHARLFDAEFLAQHAEACRGSFGKQAALAAENGCSTCHAAFGGTPMHKCASCHQDLMQNQHPFPVDHRERPAAELVTASAGAGDCNVCHVDHLADAIVPSVDDTIGRCSQCHSGTQVTSDGYVPSRALREVPFDRQKRVASFSFRHVDHREAECGTCHALDPEAERERSEVGLDDPLRDDFAPVPFETCAKCHVEELVDERIASALRPSDAAHIWRVGWHGSDAEGKCVQCHDPATEVWRPGLRQVDRVSWTVATYSDQRARFQIRGKSHSEFFSNHSEGRACTECHKSGVVQTRLDQPRTFWHALHVDAAVLDHADPAAASTASEQCAECHAAALQTSGLSSPMFEWPADGSQDASCVGCHVEGTVSSPGAPLAPRPRTVDPEGLDSAGSTPEFPHDVHGDIQGGCFACHGFNAPVDDPLGPLHAVPTTLPEARSCVLCHDRHDNIGGGDCQQCHPSPAGSNNVYLTSRPLAAATPTPTDVGATPPTTEFRSWPKLNAFSHFSRGHVESIRSGDCSSCHRGTESSESWVDLPIPTEADAMCRECHLNERARFHWR